MNDFINDFVKVHEVIVERSAFLAFSRAQNEGESNGEIKSERLKGQLSQVKGELNLQEMLKLISIPKKRHQDKKKKVVIFCVYVHPLSVVRIKKRRKKIKPSPLICQSHIFDIGSMN
jgi:hypothetical protein